VGLGLRFNYQKKIAGTIEGTVPLTRDVAAEGRDGEDPRAVLLRAWPSFYGRWLLPEFGKRHRRNPQADHVLHPINGGCTVCPKKTRLLTGLVLRSVSVESVAERTVDDKRLLDLDK